MYQSTQPSERDSNEEFASTKRRKKQTCFWRQHEHQKYLNFVKNNAVLLKMDAKERTKFKVNVMMSEKIKTRVPLQCHNHHVRMLQKFGSIDNILSHIEEEAEKKKKACKEKREKNKLIKKDSLSC